jgi:regulator of sigma E protease
MSWLLAFLGFSALIILHELGHFAVAKAVGMRVERFSLFFPPLIWRWKGKSETEYAIGAIPLGGYVKISGMNPLEVLPPGQEHRAYFRQPVWKRVAVILAGPMVNILLAGAILTALVLANGKPTNGALVVRVEPGQPASGVLMPGDRVIAVDRRTGTIDTLAAQIAKHRCKGRLTLGCHAAKPATLVVERDGRRITEVVYPVYDARRHRMRVGFTQAVPRVDVGLLPAIGGAADEIGRVTSVTVSTVGRALFSAQDRKQVSGVVGGYEAARQAVQRDASWAFYVLALLSLSLGVINLFPFLPLDGGHIFWALAEKVRRRPIPFAVMERAGFVGFALVAFLFVIGLTNDIQRITNGGFGLPK